jgi:hypothetical protein
MELVSLGYDLYIIRVLIEESGSCERLWSLGGVQDVDVLPFFICALSF